MGVDWQHYKSYHYLMDCDERHTSKGKNVSHQPDEIQAAIDYGIDIQMLTDNLRRTPAKRIRRHQIALNTAKKLRKARRP